MGLDDRELDTALAGLRHPWFGAAAHDVQLTRWAVLRGVGLVYFVAYLALVRQVLPLLGRDGLLPIASYLPRVREHFDSPWRALAEVPSVLWLADSDTALLVLSGLGLAVSSLVLLGVCNAPMMALLWGVYLSFVHAGQIFFGYGWEILLCEAGFLAIFLAPPWRPWPDVARVPALPVLWMYRWLLFRVMFGAGMIKIRGDDCWRDLTCLVYHYETQPNPHPISWLWHQAPVWFHQVGTAFNHFVELLVPWGLFGPRRVRHVAGALTILFQTMLILSGNLSFLNWATIAVALACFDDSVFRRCLPARLAQYVEVPTPKALSKRHARVILALSAAVGLLSLNPIFNLLSPRQRMNAGFDPLHLVNAYGAFGSIGRERLEVVIEGSASATLDADTTWKEYEFPCKPGNVARAPCWITPYHLRMDWQMWFAALSNYQREPWIVHLVYQLLSGNPSARSFFEVDPFPDQPPRFVRATLYRYQLTHFGDDGWWTRSVVGPYIGATSLEDPSLLEFVSRHGWSR